MILWKRHGDEYEVRRHEKESEALSAMMDELDHANDLEFVAERIVQNFNGEFLDVTLDYLGKLEALERDDLLDEYNDPASGEPYNITVEEYLETRDSKFQFWRTRSYHGKAVKQLMAAE